MRSPRAEANIAKQEKEILLKQKEAEVMEQSLDAQVRKKAEAERFARQQKADAELYERQREAGGKKIRAGTAGRGYEGTGRG